MQAPHIICLVVDFFQMQKEASIPEVVANKFLMYVSVPNRLPDENRPNDETWLYKMLQISSYISH